MKNQLIWRRLARPKTAIERRPPAFQPFDGAGQLCEPIRRAFAPAPIGSAPRYGAYIDSFSASEKQNASVFRGIIKQGTKLVECSKNHEHKWLFF